MTQQAQVISVPSNADEVVCNGGNPALGHPTVYYSFEGKNEIRCGYCDRIFVKSV